MMIHGYTIDFMQLILLVALACILMSFYFAHKSTAFEFNAFDLVMENGRVSKIAVAFMVVLGLTTWVMIKLAISGHMTEGYMATYGTMWVSPLIARVVFNKQEPSPPEK